MINLIFRSKKRNEFSIEIIFEALGKELIQQGEQVEYSYLPSEHYNSISSILQNIKYIKKLKGDIYHITGEVYFTGMFLPSKNVIMTIADLVMLEPTHAKGLKYLIFKYFWFYFPIKRAKYVTCISQKVKEDVLELFPQFEEKVKVIPCQYGKHLMRQNKIIDLSCPRILLVGTKYNKNVERVIEAVEGISCILDIVGALTVEQRTLLQSTNANYNNYMQLSNEEMFDRYCESDIVCFPSIYEGFGMPIIEAQVVGRPVVTSNIRPMSDVAGDAAILIDPYDIGQIRDAILKIMGDYNYSRELIEKGYINAEKYSLEKVTKEYMKLYKSI